MADEHETIWAVPRKSNWVKLTIVIPAEMFAVWDSVVNEIERTYGPLHEVEPVRYGQALEVLTAEFLGGVR